MLPNLKSFPSREAYRWLRVDGQSIGFVIERSLVRFQATPLSM